MRVGTSGGTLDKIRAEAVGFDVGDVCTLCCSPKRTLESLVNLI